MSELTLKNTKQERQAGIEILRIISILMVLLIHVLGQGNVLGYAALASVKESHPLNYPVSWYLEVLGYGCVDLFGLISGFVGYKSKFKISRLFKIWISVMFWNTILYLLVRYVPVLFEIYAKGLKLIMPSVKDTFTTIEWTQTDYNKLFLPVLTKTYWYFSAYIFVFFIAPVVNIAFKNMNKGNSALIVIALFILFTILPTLTRIDLFLSSWGYSGIWLLVCYITGAFSAKFEFLKKVKWYYLLLIFIGCTTLSWGFRMLMDNLSLKEGLEYLKDYRGMFIQYTSPFVFFGSICLLCLFGRIDFDKPKLKKAIRFCSMTSFQIYIIHVNHATWKFFFANRFYGFAYDNTFLMILGVFLSVLILYVTFVLLEQLRLLLFKINFFERFINWLGNLMDRFIDYLSNKIKGKSKEEIESITTTS